MADFKSYTQENGPKLTCMDTALIEQDGLLFKDLARCGRLLPYEDWRLPAKERARDLAARLSPDEIAGLMVISGHQTVPAPNYKTMPATYGGESFDRARHQPWELTDQLKDIIRKERLRFILQSRVESSEVSVR